MTATLLLVCQRNNNIPIVFEVAARHGAAVVDVHDVSERPQSGMPALAGNLALDIFGDPDGALDRLEAWARENPVDGIMTSREEAIVWTARAAERLGLPGLPVDAARACRDKAEMRRRFRAAGCNVKPFLDLDVPDEARLLPSLAYPFVLKPKSAVASAGVTLVRNDAERDAAIAQISDMNARIYNRFRPDGTPEGLGVLAEGFIDGPEYVAECFARDGVQHVVSVGFKGDPRGPYFEETVYLAPSGLPDHVLAAVIAEAKKGMSALGLTDGPGHCEMRIDADGTPYILQIGARVGGSGSCHFVVEESTGFDFFGAQISFALGRDIGPIPASPAPVGAASNYIIPLRGSGVLDGIEGLEAAASHPECVRLMRFIPDGATVRPYPEFSGFVGFVLGRHASVEAGLAQFAWLDEHLRPRWRPAS